MLTELEKVSHGTATAISHGTKIGTFKNQLVAPASPKPGFEQLCLPPRTPPALCHPSRLPNPKPRRAQANAQFNFHVHGGLVWHGVVGLVQIGQQTQAKALHIGIGL